MIRERATEEKLVSALQDMGSEDSLDPIARTLPPQLRRVRKLLLRLLDALEVRAGLMSVKKTARPVSDVLSLYALAV